MFIIEPDDGHNTLSRHEDDVKESFYEISSKKDGAFHDLVFDDEDDIHESFDNINSHHDSSHEKYDEINDKGDQMNIDEVLEKEENDRTDEKYHASNEKKDDVQFDEAMEKRDHDPTDDKCEVLIEKGDIKIDTSLENRQIIHEMNDEIEDKISSTHQGSTIVPKQGKLQFFLSILYSYINLISILSCLIFA